MKGLYIHIPFCKHRCIYCDFYSTVNGKSTQAAYIEALCAELEGRHLYAGSPELSSIYIGGGTPSVLDGEAIQRIFHCIERDYRTALGAEITIEANPDDITPKFVDAIKSTPVNRISLGVQTFQDSSLHFLKRRHTGRQAQEAILELSEAGFNNISMDLIYGLPRQTLETWKEDLKKAFELPISHLSAYALIYEEGTQIEGMRKRGEIKEVGEDLSLSMFETLMDEASSNGFVHYEISNFARPGMEARHNSSYWAGQYYLGCGPGAHSFDGKSRRANLPDLQSYNSHKGNPPCSEEFLSENDRFNELILTSLRTRDGLSMEKVAKKFGKESQEFVLRVAHPHIVNGKLDYNGEALRLTRSGLFVSDSIMSDLMKI